jgi:hypothetical protein
MVVERRSVWEDNIKVDLKERMCEGVDWIRLAQGRIQWLVFVHTVIKLPVPWRGISGRICRLSFHQGEPCAVVLVVIFVGVRSEQIDA